MSVTTSVTTNATMSATQQATAASASPHLLYLTWGEVIVHDGLFNNQVLEQLKQIRRQDERLPMRLLSGIPLGNRYLVKGGWGFYREIAKIRQQLSAAQIGFGYRWLPAVARWFHSQPYQFPFYSVGQLGFLAGLVKRQGINLIHCRSYHATRIALLARGLYGLPVKVIFDTRGMFPEEAVLAGYFSAESPAYQRWKVIERHLLDGADAIVNVSATFTDYVQTLTTNPRLHTIATSTNLDLFRPDPAQRQAQRAALGFAPEAKVLLYVGSLGTKRGWHNIANLLAVYQVFAQAFAPTKLLIVTRSPHAPLVELLQQGGYHPADYRLVAAASPQETSHYAQAGDYAALSYYDVNNPLEAQVGRTVIASKSGEYLGLGLPMIVNQTAGAAAQLVANTGVGCVYQGGNEAALLQPLQALAANYAAVQAKAVAVAQAHFSATGNARKYLDLYAQLLGEPTPAIMQG